MSNENPKPNYEGDRTVILPGGLPPIKEIEVKKPIHPKSPERPAALDLAEIQRNQANSRRVAPVLKRLEVLLTRNAPYVGAAIEFADKLEAEIANPTDSAA